MRRIASPRSGAVGRIRILGQVRIASVGAMESVMTRAFSFDPLTLATAPPDNTPCVA